MHPREGAFSFKDVAKLFGALLALGLGLLLEALFF